MNGSSINRYWCAYRYCLNSTPSDSEMYGAMGIERQTRICSFNDIIETQAAIARAIAESKRVDPSRVGVMLLSFTRLEEPLLIMTAH